MVPVGVNNAPLVPGNAIAADNIAAHNNGDIVAPDNAVAINNIQVANNGAFKIFQKF